MSTRVDLSRFQMKRKEEKREQGIQEFFHSDWMKETQLRGNQTVYAQWALIRVSRFALRFL